MGVRTTSIGHVEIEPPLDAAERSCLSAFSARGRRIARLRRKEEPVKHAFRFTGEDVDGGPERDPQASGASPSIQ